MANYLLYESVLREPGVEVTVKQITPYLVEYSFAKNGVPQGKQRVSQEATGYYRIENLDVDGEFLGFYRVSHIGIEVCDRRGHRAYFAPTNPGMSAEEAMRPVAFPDYSILPDSISAALDGAEAHKLKIGQAGTAEWMINAVNYATHGDMGGAVVEVGAAPIGGAAARVGYSATQKGVASVLGWFGVRAGAGAALGGLPGFLAGTGASYVADQASKPAIRALTNPAYDGYVYSDGSGTGEVNQMPAGWYMPRWVSVPVENQLNTVKLVKQWDPATEGAATRLTIWRDTVTAWEAANGPGSAGALAQFNKADIALFVRTNANHPTIGIVTDAFRAITFLDDADQALKLQAAFRAGEIVADRVPRGPDLLPVGTPVQIHPNTTQVWDVSHLPGYWTRTLEVDLQNGVKARIVQQVDKLTGKPINETSYENQNGGGWRLTGITDWKELKSWSLNRASGQMEMGAFDPNQSPAQIFAPPPASVRPSSLSFIEYAEGSHVRTAKLRPPISDSQGNTWTASLSDLVASENARGNAINVDDVLANNPWIVDKDRVRYGVGIHIPLRRGNEVVYSFDNGVSVNTNRQTGEYHVVVPNSDGKGGQTVYARTFDGNALGGEGWTVREVRTDAAGNTVYEFTGRQQSLESEITRVVERQQYEVLGTWGSPTGATATRTTFGVVDGIETITETRVNPTTVVIDVEKTLNSPSGPVTVSSSEQFSRDYRNSFDIESDRAHEEKWSNIAMANVAELLGALRSKDRLRVLLAGAKIYHSIAELQGIPNPALGTFLGGATSAVGVLSAIKGLQSDNFRTQVNSAVSLLNNADSLVKHLQGPQGTGFLPPEATKFLGAVGAVMSIAALGDLDDMIENKQYGAAISTVANAINGVGFFASGMTNMFYFIPGPWMVAIAIFSAILDSMAEEPPPPPPVGEAIFKRLGDGSLGYEILNAANGGQEILAGQLDALLIKLNQQLLEANQGNTDPDRELHMIASRMPKITLVSWASFDEGNNYFFSIQQTHPTTGELVYSGIARQDLVKHFGEALVLPEAIVQKWTLDHLSSKFGPDEANWKTEGQFLAIQSAVEQQRKSLKQSLEAAEDAVAAARENNLQAGEWLADGLVTGNVTQGQSAAQAAVSAAEAALVAAKTALEAFEAANPADPQMAARIIDPAITDPKQMEAAREAAKYQWLKAIAIDLGGDGIQTTALPAVVGKDLDSIQSDGVTRFDVDNDGYREATEWIAASDAILGIDRDGNGLLDSANELFNGISTPFDQRGLASLKYYDTNGDNRISAVDPVFKLLRLWIDLNGDGSAGTMETYDLQMRHPGVDMAALSARLDAAGQAAMAALQNSAVQYIDLSTFQLHLADQTTSQATEVALKSEVEGIMIAVDDATQNISVLHENGLRENYITLVEDMSALLELDNPSITAARRTELQALALRYGLNTQAADFMTVVRSLRAGGENMAATGAAVYFGSDDVWADPNVRTRLEQMRFSFHSAQSVGSADVFGTARIGTPIAIGTGTSTPVFNDGWLPAHHVQQGEVVSDAATAAPPPPNPERWVLLSDVYNLDYVVRGAQLGGLVTQQAVIASNAAVPNAPQQTIQVFTAAAPTMSLDAVTINGGEDEQFGFGFTQLEQEARTLIPGSTAATAVRLLGVRSVAHGRVEINEELGRVQFIADANYYGTEAGFSYAVMDDQGRVLERRVHFNLAEVNDGPNVLGETVHAQEDVPLLLDAATLLANDSDLEGDSLSIIGIGRVGMGRAQLLQNGQIRYTPPADLYGVTDTIEYIVQDARGASAVAVIKITLHAVDDAPTVVSEVIRNAKEDTNLRIDPALLLANDYDADFHNQVGAEHLRITAVGNASNGGSVFMDAAGTIIFVPAENYHGTATFDYTVTDSTGLSTVGKAEVEIGAVNDGPRAFGELITSQEDQKLVIDPDLLLANDDDIDIGRGENQRLMVVAVDQAVNGTVKLENGHVSFTPAHNFNGEASFRYTVSDGAGGFAQAIARIAISGENDAPTVLNRTYIGQEDTAYTFTAQDLLAGVLDPEDGATGVELVDVSDVTGATLELVDDHYVLTPGANFSGIAQFKYTVRDAQGLQSTGEVAVKFNNVNDAPIFIPGSSFTSQGEEDQAIRISLAAVRKMFVDVDGDDVQIDPAGLAAVQAGDTVTYDAVRQEIVFKAAANANGLRHFDLRVMDGQGGYSSTQRLGVDIKALNDSPIVNAVAFKVLEDGGWNDPTKQATNYISYSLLLGNASDAEGDTLSIHSIGNARTGDGRAVTIFQDPTLNRLGFVTPLNYNGTISFDFTVSDGKGGLTTQKAYGTVVPVDDVPTVRAVNIASDYSYDYWRLDATDVDGTIVAYGVDRHPLRGTLYMGQSFYWQPPGTYTDESGLPFEAPGRYYPFPVAGAPNDVVILTIDGKGYAAEWQTAVMTATDSGGNVGKANLNFLFRWDPIVIDLDSDGLEFLDISESSVLIDRNGDGTNERSAWVKGTEGILAWDHNADGVINRYDEIEFWSHVNPVDITRTDLQSLARPEFDSNQDGVFNSLDSKWGEFKLWRDLNENGVSDAGELATLDEAGVAALHLHANVLNRRYGADVVVRGYTRLEMTDGRMLAAGDVQLSMQDPTTPSLATAPTEAQQQATTSTVSEYETAQQQEQAAQAAARSAGDPNFSGGLREQKVLAGRAYRYVLPADLFPALGAGASYAVTLANGQVLPAWLSYDAQTRTLSGAPQNGQLGNWAIKVTGTAAAGGATASGLLALEVASFNQAPVALGQVPMQFAFEDEAFALDIAPNFFVDREAGDTLRYSATLADGSPLPSWLVFDPATLKFHGTPAGTAVGTLQIVLKASDEANATAQTTFKLIIEGVNDAPVVAGDAPGVLGMRAGEANSHVLPAGMFIDSDAGDVLQWTVTMANGDALPSWLSFDPATRTLSGAPNAEELSAPVQLRVRVTDVAGASTSTLLTVTSTLYGTAGDDVIAGSAYSEDIWAQAGNDTLDGQGGADRLVGGTGDDTYIVDSLDTVIEYANQGVDTVVSSATWTLDDTLENLTLTGMADANGTGNASDNVLRGNDGANVLSGGAGNDTYYVGAGDSIVESVDGGADIAYASASHVLGAHVEQLVLLGTQAINGTGNAQDNSITGNSGANVLDGGAGADTLVGGGGDDTYVVDAQDTVVENAGEGVDTIVSAASCTLGATLENLTLTGIGNVNGTGNALNNVLVGNAGNNVLDGGAGADTLAGGAGNDTYILDSSSDAVSENAGEGIDSVQAGFAYTLGANVENLYLTGSAAVNGTGNALDNILSGNSAANVLTGGAGNDTYVVGAGDTVVENANEGVDTVQSSVTWTLGANVEDLTLTGTAAINGTGNALNNVLVGNAGANVLTGGAGNDTYVIDAGDTVVETVTTTVTVDQGYWATRQVDRGYWATRQVDRGGYQLNEYGSYVTDESGNPIWISNWVTETYWQPNWQPEQYWVPNLVQQTVVSDAGGIDTVQSFMSYTLGANQENLTLLGTAAINATGNALNNVLLGNAADNLLDGAAGADTMSGGAGNDTYIVDASDVLSESEGQGWDTVRSDVTWTLGVNLEELVLTGSSQANGTGNAQDNLLSGNSADNILDGGAGVDTMAGGSGSDTYIVDNAGDVIVEGEGQGADSVMASVSYSLVAYVENLYLVGSAAINGTGNALANVLSGNSAANVLTGGAGNDTYLVGAGDTVVEIANEGVDTVQSSVTWTLGDNLEKLTLTGTAAISGTGNALDNTLTGNSSANTLDGGAGADTLIGGSGDDIYIVDAADTVVESVISVTQMVDQGYYATRQVDRGNWATRQVDLGRYQTDENGNPVRDESGNPIWISNWQTETYWQPNWQPEQYWVPNWVEQTIVTDDGGTDRVIAGFSHTLGAHVENLTLTGTDNINGTGNALNNVITGNAGNNILDGGAGADTLIGGAGNDTYILDSSADVVSENAGEGLDSVQVGFAYTLGANVENLYLTGSAAVNGTGNALDNILSGNSAANVLTGGAGNDTYVVGAGDSVVENANEGVDTVQSSVAWTLGANLENLTLTGTGAINGTGNALNNVLVGNAGANVLTGGAGNDTYVIDAGDTVVETVTTTVTVDQGYWATRQVDRGYWATRQVDRGGYQLNEYGGYVTDESGNPIWISNWVTETYWQPNWQPEQYWVPNLVQQTVVSDAGGIDTVQSLVSYTLGANQEDLTLLGTAAINATGNALNNVLQGNSAANTLAGGAGNDTYVLGRGAGSDTIQENDATSGNTDVVSVLAGVAADQLWFRQSGNNLEVSIVGTEDKFTIANWFVGAQYRVEQFKTADGNKTLLHSNVQNLVNAMAAFAPPPAGQTNLPSNYAASLATVIATNWQ